jgi:hypothetical protein
MKYINDESTISPQSPSLSDEYNTISARLNGIEEALESVINKINRLIDRIG